MARRGDTASGSGRSSRDRRDGAGSHLEVAIDFDGEAQVLTDAFREDPSTWLPELHFPRGRGRWQLYLWVGGLGVLVDCAIGPAYATAGMVSRPVRWDPGEADRTSPLGPSAPAFDGDLRLATLPGKGLRLTLEGAYEPPSSTAGPSIDLSNLTRLAEATAHEFLIDIHRRLASRHPQVTGAPRRLSARESWRAPTSIDAKGLEILGVEECLRLLGTQNTGRIAVIVERKPLVLPVNYAMHRGTVVFRTDPGTKLDAALGEEYVSFEVDEIDQRYRTGWSVLVVGQAERVYQPEELEELRRLPLQPWAPGHKAHYVRVLSTAISGRRIPAPKTSHEQG
jgi:nitroimidazol reductase NimA-like FMN-containing flavoprotein (pyridoxamine 5'-phosphate oxidase superfamily)